MSFALVYKRKHDARLHSLFGKPDLLPHSETATFGLIIEPSAWTVESDDSHSLAGCSVPARRAPETP